MSTIFLNPGKARDRLNGEALEDQEVEGVLLKSYR
jgi:hypothetical protein